MIANAAKVCSASAARYPQINRRSGGGYTGTCRVCGYVADARYIKQVSALLAAHAPASTQTPKGH